MNAPLSKQRIPFDYLVTAVLTASGTLQVVLNLATDSNFELHAILGTSSADKATDFSPNNFACQITDQTTGRQFASNRIPQRILCGTAYQAILERVPIVFPALASIQFDFQDLSAAPSTVNMVLKGYKLLL